MVSARGRHSPATTGITLQRAPVLPGVALFSPWAWGVTLYMPDLRSRPCFRMSLWLFVNQ